METNIVYLIGIIAAVAAGYGIYMAVRAYLRFYGTRLVTCPETKKTAAVALDAPKAARESFLGAPHFRLSACSRWPERQGCGQECLAQIEKAPEDCLVRNIVSKWYAEKECAYCHKPFESVDDIFHHKPALMGADLESREWGDIQPEQLPEVFRASVPVCWSCHMIETFRHEHPDLVVDNPWQNREGEWVHRDDGAPAAKRNTT